MSDNIIKFLRRKDYKLLAELGQGACGKTVLLLDEEIDERFVCKKYTPYSEDRRQELFDNFVKEIKILHGIYHQNIVRVFSYYIYTNECRGYILMEYVDGMDIFDYLKQNPEKINEIFIQVIGGFKYLATNGILHRDIRPGNVMVRKDGIVKIIDLGFGKRVQNSEDFNKSISLNWWCATPSEFSQSVYNFCTEVYFIGKLFELMMHDFDIDSFQYKGTLAKMCERNPDRRIQSFSEVEKEVAGDLFVAIDFSQADKRVYRGFADQLKQHITKIQRGARYKDDAEKIQTDLEDAHRASMLEVSMPDAGVVINCFVIGSYYYKSSGFPAKCVIEFVRLLKSSPPEKKRIIISNIHSRLDTVKRYDAELDDDDIPF